MINLGMDTRPSASVTAEKAISFISKGWKEVRNHAGADLQLMRARANSIMNLADRELENFLHSASIFSVPSQSSMDSSPELEFVKRFQPKLSDFRRAYSSPGFSRMMLEKWGPRSSIRIDLSRIRNAIVWEANYSGRTLNFDSDRASWWKENSREKEHEWEPFQKLKERLKEFEQKTQPSDLFWTFKSNELVEKVKLSLKSFCKEPEESKEVCPLDLPELLAYLVKQSAPLFDQLGIRRDICDKIVESLCSKQKAHPLSDCTSAEDPSLLEHQNINNDLDFRIASVLQSTGHHSNGGYWSDYTNLDVDDKKRHVAIVTTACLPWMTGTAVNPLFRAAYLAKCARQKVTLVVPWLCVADQVLVYPNSLTFSTPEEQESYIRNWLEERVGFKTDFKISFYPGKFSKERRSIIPAGDTSEFIPSKKADIAILEEPEHLNWYHHGKRWTDKFSHVIGVVHTNYLEYIKREKNGAIQAFFVKHINNMVTRAYCHKVLRLSAATQDLPRSVVCNVHGVNPKFLEVGERMAAERESGRLSFSKGAYFLGKMVWAKGYKELIYLLAENKDELPSINIDVYGNGEDSHEVQSTAQKLQLNINFKKGRDHSDDSLHGYKVFINPSVSDVLCTATAEALAMGKFVICADHPSNDFFRAFPNCLTYRNSKEFVAKVKQALASNPHPLTATQRYNLSWEAATQRFIEFSELDRALNGDLDGKISRSISMPRLSELVDGGLAFAHYCLTGNEILRLSTGAIPGTRDYDKQHCVDLRLLPPQVQYPIYGW